MRYALVNTQTSIVENIIIWDGSVNIVNTELYLPIQLSENEECFIGYEYNATESPRFYAGDFIYLNL